MGTRPGRQAAGKAWPPEVIRVAALAAVVAAYLIAVPRRPRTPQ